MEMHQCNATRSETAHDTEYISDEQARHHSVRGTRGHDPTDRTLTAGKKEDRRLHQLSYHGDCDRVSMDKDLVDPNNRMICDVLIYSPTITAGVSIEVDHYDELFGFFTDRSCNAYNAA
jgi:hypothetical protein